MGPLISDIIRNLMFTKLTTVIRLIVRGFLGWGDWGIVGMRCIGSLIGLKDGQRIGRVMVRGKIGQMGKYSEYTNL